ncbi:MAG: hypothetical protein VKI81_08195 [Synechococcaceae cyanobacterium]|nr:hypothetical protein [Synechococcaceae cyanobacterium]
MTLFPRLTLPVWLLSLSFVPPALVPGETAAQPVRPTKPQERVVYDPDRDTCTPDAITTAYRNHLRPWADQPEPVLARLRLLQQSMTRTTLSRCVQGGHLTPEEARRLAGEIGLPPAAATPPSAAPPQTVTRP